MAAQVAMAEPGGRAAADGSLFGSKVDIGLLAGHTLTADRKTGYRGTSVHDEGAWLYQGPGLPLLELQPGLEVQFSAPEFARPLLGAFAEVSLRRDFSVQASVLFRTLGGQVLRVFPADDVSQALSVKRLDIWEIPVLVQYRFGAAPSRPFVGLGPAFRFSHSRKPLGQLHEPSRGAAATVGIDLRWGRRWTVTPQAIYTRWARDERPSMPANQFQLLIGLSF